MKKEERVPQDIKELADGFIKKLRIKCYGSLYASNESEGDYGMWDDWRDALAEFGVEIHDTYKKP